MLPKKPKQTKTRQDMTSLQINEWYRKKTYLLTYKQGNIHENWRLRILKIVKS